MIRVDRAAVVAPASLEATHVARARAAAAAHFQASDARARQTTHRFAPFFEARDVREALLALFSNKCAFCESPLGGTIPGQVHPFRPRQDAVDPRSGETSRRHYWWLAYEWDNLYLSCSRCSRAAGGRFPVEGRRAKSGSTGKALASERPVLLDPCLDDPAGSLLFQSDGSIEPRDLRGAQTIETFGLNRPSLVSARLNRLRQVEALLWTGGDVLHEVGADDAPYAGAIRQLIGALSLGDTPDFAGRRPLPEPALGLPHSVPARVLSVAIRNFRAIEELDLAFEGEPDSWTMLLGENGDGKTSVLQALAIALMNGSQRSRIDSTPYLRHGARSGTVSVELSDRTTREIRFSSDDNLFTAERAKPLVLAGYGAYRAPGKGAPRRSIAPRVTSLLSPYVRLISPGEWLLHLDRRNFDAAAKALTRLLLADDGLFLRRQGRVLFERGGSRVELDELSAGYRSTVAVAIDLMSYMLTRWGDLVAAEGVVLIDEIGTHLHPRWQMKVVSAFRDAFPRIQFIATTHDPLCLRGLRNGEVVVLKRDPEGAIFALSDLPAIEGLFVDQLLTSEYFGLGSTLDPEIEDAFAEYYDLLSVRSPDARQRARIAELQLELEERGQLGATERERLVLQAADRALALRAVERTPERRSELAQDAEVAIASLWRESGLG